MFTRRLGESAEQVPDYNLVQEYLSGDHRAFAEIFQRYHRPMWWLARRYARCDHDIHDILQEAFLRASLNLHSYRRDASLRTWLHRLVANAGYDYNRRQHFSPVFLTDDGELPDYGYHPVRAKELTLTIAFALRCLNPEQRVALLLVDLVGHTVDEVAMATDTATGTVKSRRSRARRMMRSELEGELIAV